MQFSMEASDTTDYWNSKENLRGQRNGGTKQLGTEQAVGEQNLRSKGLQGIFDRVRTLPYTGWILGFHSSSLEDTCIKN